ncbi:MAG: hypothetical protein EPN86_05700 [Nanoarchaeota archaeon]|nr:MAG: hypothetical protein EPN86_05700 [Nanoarchaeota archaeon]
MNPLKPSVWIGKRGLTESQISEIKAQLDKKKLIKVKILKSSLGEMNQKEIAAKIASSCDCELVSVTGLVAVLRKNG